MPDMYSASTMLAKAKENNILSKKRSSLYYREVYLKSDHWKLLREEKLVRNPVCQKCRSTSNLNVHHKKYRELFDVKLSDLKTLCGRCHDKEHKKINKKKNKKKNIKKTLYKEKKIYHKEGYGKPVNLSPRNKERQIIFNKTINWKHKDMNNYVSIHY